jgi:hypothetical protein
MNHLAFNIGFVAVVAPIVYTAKLLLRRARGRTRHQRYTVNTILYYAALAGWWSVCDLAYFPLPIRVIGIALLLVGYLLTPDDDDDHRPRRRLRSALKRVKTWLAVGIPAAQPEAGRA